MAEDDWESKVAWMRERGVKTAAWDGAVLVECELGPEPRDESEERPREPTDSREPVFPVPAFGSRLMRKVKPDVG